MSPQSLLTVVVLVLAVGLGMAGWALGVIAERRR